MIRYKVVLVKDNTKEAVWITVMGVNKRMAYEKAVQMCYDNYTPIYDSIEEIKDEEDLHVMNQAS